jgi:Domain of unknown function (DUF5666)
MVPPPPDHPENNLGTFTMTPSFPPRSSLPVARLRLLGVSLLLAGLTACGGGGGSDDSAAADKSYKGTVTAFSSPQSFSVDGIPVDASTSSTAPQGLATGSRVEVQGEMVNGTLRARRVELDDDHGGDDNGSGSSELEGRVTSYTSPTSFSVDGIPVDASAAPATLSVDMHVEVHGTVSNGVMVATRVEVEGSDDDRDDDGKDDDNCATTAAKSSCSDDGKDDDKNDDKDDDEDDDKGRRR